MQSTLMLFSGKTSPESSAQKTTPSAASSLRLLAAMNPSYQSADGQVTAWCLDRDVMPRGLSRTLNITDWHSGAVVCSLSQVLETGLIPAKYFLSGKACRGILRRAEKRGKELPAVLRRALLAVADSELTSTSGGGYSLSPSLTSSGRGVSRAGDSRGQDCVIPILEPGSRTGKSTEDVRCSDGIGEPGGMGRIDYETETLVCSEVAPCLTQNYGKQPDNSDTNAGPMLVTHALRPEGHDASEDGTGRGTPLVPVMRAVALAIRGRDGVPQIEMGDDVANAILTPNGGRGGIGVGAVMTPAYGVRRLTPVECERLQGFQDDYTNPVWNQKRPADGPRYKALGNSMAVPCIGWIIRRIERELAARSAAA